MANEPDLAELLGNLAVDLEYETDAEATLVRIVSGSVDVVPGAQWAGVSLVEGKQVKPRVPTDPLVEVLDSLQTDLDEGPCLTALREKHTVNIADMELEERWPRFARAAVAHGVRSLMSFRLFVRGNTMGALNLYGDRPDAFDDESRHIGTILAQHASVALAATAADSQFQQALSSRDVIGQAKGLLMQRNNVSALQAFDMLMRVSQDTNHKLADVARRLVELHENGTR